jgi:predicted nucleic acid-binding protein
MAPIPILVDSTVLIDVLRGQATALTYLANARRSNRLMSVTPVRTEVLGGVAGDMVRGTFTLFRTLDWIDITIELADVAAALRRRHRAAHAGIGVVDYLLAAAALEIGGVVATSNIRDFPMFPGLQPPY